MHTCIRWSFRHSLPLALCLAAFAGAALVSGCGGGGGGTTAPPTYEGTLVLRTTPPGATVLINGVEIAERTPTEVTRTVAPGGTTFEVVFRLAGYEEARQSVVLRPSQAQTVSVTLRQLLPPDIPPHTITGRVLYQSGTTYIAAPNATVVAKETSTQEEFRATMDTSSARAGTYYIFAPPGTYQVTATLSGYQPQTRQVTVLSGEDRVTGVDFTLRR